MKTILVDCDDTIVNTLEVWVDELNSTYNLNVKYEDIKEWDMSKSFPMLSWDEIYRPLTIPSFWDKVKPKENAVEVLQRLSHNFEIYIVTATDYRIIKEKVERVIKKYFPCIDDQHIITSYNKKILKGDYIIDDNFDNLRGGYSVHNFLFPAPHNKNINEFPEAFRVKDWLHIERLINVIR